MPTGAYSMQIGDADAGRLQILGQFYDPISSDFLGAVAVVAGQQYCAFQCRDREYG
jgi:hypothetical protein